MERVYLPPEAEAIGLRARRFIPDPDEVGMNGARTHMDRRFVLEPLRSLRQTLAGEWLIKGLLPSHGLAAIYGPPGCGKSFVALDCTMHIAAGIDWSGRKVKQAGVVYVAAEGGTGVRKRAVANCSEKRIPADAPFALITTAPNLGTQDGDAETLINDIQDQCAELRIHGQGGVARDLLAGQRV